MKRPNPKDVNPYDSKALKRTYRERYMRMTGAKWFIKAYKNRSLET